jgi:hydroxypyruvate isomerase
LGYLLGALPMAERFSAAKRLGFDAVEYPFPYEMPAQQYARLLNDNGLQQVSIGAPACNYRKGDPGFSLTPALRFEFDRSLDTAIEFATRIRCGLVHIFAGSKAPEVSTELAFETYCSNLSEAAGRLQREGLKLVIEAVNSQDFPGYFMDRLARVIAAIEQMRHENIDIVLDIYHACVNREDPVGFLREHGDKIAHIQLADFPGRHEPGSGSIDFDAFFTTLDEVGYSGSVGLEYVPTRSIFDGVPLAAQLWRYRRKTKPQPHTACRGGQAVDALGASQSGEISD